MTSMRSNIPSRIASVLSDCNGSGQSDINNLTTFGLETAGLGNDDIPDAAIDADVDVDVDDDGVS